MRLLITSIVIWLISGCSTVSMVDSYQQKQLSNAGFERNYLTLAQDGELHYWQGGNEQDPVIILLHGFGGTGMTSWYETMQNLVVDYHIIVPDLLWFGDSYSHAPATIESETSAIQQLISELRLKQVNLVGISFGGFVTFDLMIKAPEVKKAMMLASPGIVFSDADMDAMSERLGQTTPEAVFVPQDKEGVRHLLEHTFVAHPWYPSFIDEQIYQTYFANYLEEKRSLITTLPAYRNQLEPAEFRDNLPPSLLIWGENDQVFPLEKGHEFSVFLDAPLIIIPDASHGLTNDFPELINQMIRDFIK
ncbi:alpha/beta hydrolase [Shewanella sp. UCD-FRSSP16_17]|uniref:alpha/beta fold hydrolase n=1 Tax=Shewanella sp. UCD-FRSSP16_17 TaxID=1853256 RepID=UPI0007EED222|nr:alpha/beta hydrolase [Shewanella sp. UCD-FRSSP16_17]OBT09243.1 alpha/beta hydrolase [Shewanella sp. UCD-FRSSP16_17]